MKKYDYLLFDLDGTLIESAESVRVSLAHAMEALGLPCPDLSDYTKYVGPPLEDTFRGMCAVPEDQIERGMILYRDYYDEVGQQSNRLFDGVIEMLTALRERGFKIAVCTSKNEPVAERVCDKMGLSPYLDAICGSTFDGSRRAKADIIPYAIETLGCRDKENALMIGDTDFDARGAQLAGVDFLGVTYGYGTVESMQACGAIGFAKSPAEIVELMIEG
ncbi:HAD hydrolase-like protein [uncultured Ruminococcus sp.]|uniref:HAD hydrolase-like protein n=1 Tax=uncultured Ruminococcus sp. TaxID=165186 RepID=UPI0029308AC0|nr:HAD hydrolase-like protein [uncultured Ruminococcus sp.]